VAESKILTSASGEFTTGALFPFDAEQKTQFYELRLAPGGTENAEAHTAGTLSKRTRRTAIATWRSRKRCFSW
jgi:XRE family transcriptional regulator, regulator of sulfur utilization